MANYSNVSAKLPPELKEKIKRYKIPISETIREAFEDKVKQIELSELEESAATVLHLFERVKTEDIVKMIREDRDSR